MNYFLCRFARWWFGVAAVWWVGDMTRDVLFGPWHFESVMWQMLVTSVIPAPIARGIYRLRLWMGKGEVVEDPPRKFLSLAVWIGVGAVLMFILRSSQIFWFLRYVQGFAWAFLTVWLLTLKDFEEEIDMRLKQWRKRA